MAIMDQSTMESSLRSFRIRSAIMEMLYQPYEVQYTSEITSIILANCNLLNVDIPAFRYDMNVYHMSEVSHIVVGPSHKIPRLHQELEPRMLKLVQERKQIYGAEKITIDASITQILIMKLGEEDLLKILPDVFHAELRKISGKRDPDRLCTEEQIEQIKETHKEAWDLMKFRLLSNLMQYQ